jgi:hypothetical protein
MVTGEFVLFNSYITCRLVPPISSFFLLLVEEFSLQLQHLTPHSDLLVAVFTHFMEMFVGVRPCVAIFRHFYALVGLGRSKREVGAYYCQLQHEMSGSYISAFSSAKWEDWRDDWVIATTDANDCLELLTEGSLSDRSSWKAKPSLPMELDPVLDQVKTLVRSGLTSTMVLGDFLRRRIAPLQQRSKMACMFMGSNDCCRIVRGLGTNLTSAELEASIRMVTSEVYSPKSLVLPRGIKALCEDQAMRSAVLASMPTLDEGGLAVRHMGGDPNRGIQIPSTSPDRQQHADQGPGGSCHGGPAPTGKGKGKEPEPERCHNHSVRSASTWKDDEARGAATTRSSQEQEEARSQRLRRDDGSFVREPAPKRQKTTELGGRVAPRLHHHRRNMCSHWGDQRWRGGLHCSNKLRHHSRHCSTRQRRHHHHRSEGRRLRLRRQGRPRWEDPTRCPGHLPHEGRIPQSPSGTGWCVTSSKQLTPHAFLCSI